MLKYILVWFSSILLKSKLHCTCINKGFAWRIKSSLIEKSSIVSIGHNTHVKRGFFNLGENSRINIGDYSRLFNVKFHLVGTQSSVVIGNCCILQNLELWIEDSNNKIVIGDNVYIGGAHLAVTGTNKQITIGNDCMLSDGIVMRTGDSHAIIDVNTNQKINQEADISIDDHVWIAQNATILKGTVIKKDSVVGTGAIVSGNYGSNCLIAGIPSKVIKEGISWSNKRFL